MTTEPLLPDSIIVVSGLPRSGTSMMMRMLEAGGIEVVSDANRPADADNPRGYFEYEAVKRLRTDAAWLSQALGKAIKVISFLLRDLPPSYSYKVIFMMRDLEEVLASQRAMLQRRVDAGMADAASIAEDRLIEEDERLRVLYTRHLNQTRQWMKKQPHFSAVEVDHRDALRSPEETASQLEDFLGRCLDRESMINAVDPTLYRQRNV